MPLYDDLLEDDPDSQVIEVDDEPVFKPRPTKDDGVIISEPPIISIGRARRRRDLRLLSENKDESA